MTTMYRTVRVTVTDAQGTVLDSEEIVLADNEHKLAIVPLHRDVATPASAVMSLKAED